MSDLRPHLLTIRSIAQLAAPERHNSVVCKSDYRKRTEIKDRTKSSVCSGRSEHLITPGL